MPQIDIAYVNIFDRTEYANPVVNILETYSSLIGLSITEYENKAINFFNVKPRRMEFSLRVSDLDVDTIFDTETPLSSHENFASLSDYMVQAFDSSDAIVFEGIISVESGYVESQDIISITAYDPIVLFADADLKISSSNLDTNYKDPHDFSARLFDLVIDSYFVGASVGEKPVYDTGWAEPDWGLGDYQDLYDWDTIITDFYDDIVANKFDDAKTELTTVTDVFDYSKFIVKRGYSIKGQIIMEFIGCIVFHNSSTEKNYAVIMYNGCSFTGSSQTIDTLSENITYASAVIYKEEPGTDINDVGHNIARYFDRQIEHAFSNFAPPSDIYIYSIDGSIFDPLYWAIYFTSLYSPKVDFLNSDDKRVINACEYPQWRPLSSLGVYRERLDGTYSTYSSSKGSDYYNEFALLDEGGSPISVESIKDYDADYMYSENNDCVISTTDEITGNPQAPMAVESDWEDGIFDFYSADDTLYRYKFRVTYDAYPLAWTDFDGSGGIADASKFHKIGNISRLINGIPNNALYALANETDADYMWNTDTTDFKVSDLIKFLLASMNLYCYYVPNSFTLVRCFTTVGPPIVIAESDIIGWETQSSSPEFIDASNVLLPTLNYTGNALNPFYNTIAGLDNQTAKCKISRISEGYDAMTINSKLSISSVYWKVEKIQSFMAYHGVSLTKYLTDPI